MRFTPRCSGLVATFAVALSTGILVLPRIAVAADLLPGFSETVLASGLAGATSMAFAPDGRLLVCQQNGTLSVIKNGALQASPFTTLSVDSNGERGLLGVAFDPNFATNGFVYVYHTVPAGAEGNAAPFNRVSRFTANGDVATAGSQTTILSLDPLSSATNHNGGAIHFGPDGKLYVAVGENANPANSQSLTNRLGKILRINPDGSIPADNPTTFSGIAGSTTGLNQAIWAVGLRNPFTFAFQPGTGLLYLNDVGQNTWEEINVGTVGANYGWGSGGGANEGPFNPTGPLAPFTPPLVTYGHGGGTSLGFAIAGGAFYNPTTANFPSSFTGDYFYGDYVNGWIRYLDAGSTNSTLFASNIANPVDLQVGADGGLYYLTQGGGQVVRIQAIGAPEPGTASLLGLASVGCLGLVLRSRKKPWNTKAG